MRAYRRILDSHPHDPVAQGHLGLVLLHRSEWTQARELLQRVVDGPGRSPSVFGNLVISLYNQGLKTEALEVVDRWAESYPTDPAVVRHRSAVATGMGDMAMAQRALEEGVARFGDDPRIHVEMRRWLGDLLHAQGRLREARGHLRDARALAVAEGMHGLALAVSVDLARVRVQETGDTLGEMRRLEQYADGLAEESLARHRIDLALGDAWAHVARHPDRAEEAWSRHQAASRTGVAEGAEEEETGVYRRSLLDNLRGRHSEALEGFRDLARRTECDDCYLLEMAEAFIGVGEPDSALVRLETWVRRDLFHLVDERERRLGDVLPLTAGLFEQAGRFDDARAAWLRYAARWAEADSSLQPRVRRAVEEAERLAGQHAG
jgi:Flp pilus assembly protein TadD